MSNYFVRGGDEAVPVELVRVADGQSVDYDDIQDDDDDVVEEGARDALEARIAQLEEMLKGLTR